MSSSRSVIKPDRKAKVEKFAPPVQNLFRPPKAAKKVEKAPEEGTDAPFMEDFARQPSKEGEEKAEEDSAASAVQAEADQELERAREEADRIREEAAQEAEELKKSAFDEGFQSGYEEGYRQGLGRVEKEHREQMSRQQVSFRQEMEEALSSVEEAKNRCLRTYIEELKECSVAVAEKVIHISLESSGDIIKRMIVAETEKLKKTEWVKIYMERTDYEMMMGADADVISELSRLSDNIKFIVMDKDRSGNCIVETPEEIIDMSVDTQLQNIREILGTVQS